jgi:hypothetical protein
MGCIEGIGGDRSGPAWGMRGTGGPRGACGPALPEHGMQEPDLPQVTRDSQGRLAGNHTQAAPGAGGSAQGRAWKKG